MTAPAAGFPGFAPGEHRQLLADVHAAFIANTEARPDRTCRYCGATSGLLMVRCDVLELTPMQWQCWDDCQAQAVTQ